MFYEANLFFFLLSNAGLLVFQHRRDRRDKQATKSAVASPRDVEVEEELLDDKPENASSNVVDANNEAVRTFKINFFIPYALAVAADWLQ